MRLKINKSEQCVGCKLCESACSIFHEGSFAPWLSRIRIDRNVRTVECAPIICLQCNNAECEKACPVNAIKHNEMGILEVDQSLCTGCLACVIACPFDAMFFNEEENVAFKCDLCGGNPKCVIICPANVLEFN